MKIVLLGLRLSVGMRRLADTLGSALVGLGHDVVFIGGPHTPAPPVRGIPVHDGDSYPAMLWQTVSPGFHRRVVDAVAREAPDICYFFTVHPANGLLIGPIRRVARSAAGQAPVVAAHIHDPLPHPGLAWPLIFGAQQLAARAADRVVVYGNALAVQVTRFYGVPRRHIVVVPLGALRPPRQAAPAESAYQHFSFLGRIDGYKGLDIFLAAARMFLAGHSDARFYVGGVGSLRPHQGALAALGEAVVVENRELTNEETDRIMQASWAVVLPYTSGTQSAVIPVAYWNACPVIATRVGSIPEAVQDGESGFLVPPRDPAAVARGMGRLWNNLDLRRTMGSSSFGLYDAEFRWERIAGRLIAGLS